MCHTNVYEACSQPHKPIMSTQCLVDDVVSTQTMIGEALQSRSFSIVRAQEDFISQNAVHFFILAYRKPYPLYDMSPMAATSTYQWEHSRNHLQTQIYCKIEVDPPCLITVKLRPCVISINIMTIITWSLRILYGSPAVHATCFQKGNKNHSVFI